MTSLVGLLKQKPRRSLVSGWHNREGLDAHPWLLNAQVDANDVDVAEAWSLRSLRRGKEVDIRWVNRGLVVVSVGKWPRKKTLQVGGEVLVGDEPGDPDYLIYARSVTHWQDGTPISDEERAEVLDRLIGEAAKRGWKFEIEW
jgi:hypothetical protein